MNACNLKGSLLRGVLIVGSTVFRHHDRIRFHVTGTNFLKRLQDILYATRTSHFASMYCRRVLGSHVLRRLHLLLHLLLLLLLRSLKECSRWLRSRRVIRRLAHRRPHEIAKTRSRLLRGRRRKLLRELRIVLKNIARVHIAHL